MMHESAVELSRRIRTGELTATELMTEAIRAADAVDPQINALIWRDDEASLRDAAAADAELAAGIGVGPFHGIPLPIKELTWVAGQPGTFGSRGVSDAPRPVSDLVVDRFRDAGFVLFGRSNSPEAGPMSVTENSRFGVTRNPWNVDRSPAGSSGGAAAAVAAGIVPVAHATDGGGSIRMPASATGLVGLKPSRGRVPARVPMWEHSIVEGVITRHIEDTAAILDAISAPDPTLPYAAPRPPRPFADEVGLDGPRLRIGLLLDAPSGVPVDPECRAAAEDLARALEHLGHTVEPVRPLLHSWEAVLGFVDVIINSWLWTTPYEDAELAEPYIRARRERARAHTGGDYALAAMRLYSENVDILAQWGRDFDVLLTPTMATTPPPVGVVLAEANAAFDGPRLTENQMIAFTAFANITGQPAISLPVRMSAAGLPVGAQLIGRPFGEGELIRLAASVQEHFGWTRRHPAVAGVAG
ncbi:MAG: amidase [Microbacterium sp.]|uniref:amidase n=1 Tax=Microbacterium sp. TaxID=51671 RepID=UPI001ACA4F62|nr:amidase [Microbacterium sp.]MBN9176658.1 amidase [Microbacterium sp.]